MECFVARTGLEKMQNVYASNPKLGDPQSLTEQLEENRRAAVQTQTELRKYEVGGR